MTPSPLLYLSFVPLTLGWYCVRYGQTWQEQALGGVMVYTIFSLAALGYLS